MPHSRRLRPAPLLCWLGALIGAWLLFVGQWSGTVIMAAIAAALITLPLLWLVDGVGHAGAVRAVHLPTIARVVRQVFVDFALVTAAVFRALSRRQSAHGFFHARETVARGQRVEVNRAVTAVLATYSPNAYVIDIEPQSSVCLFHDLVADESSESPA